jgi:hypothetical protein
LKPLFNPTHHSKELTMKYRLLALAALLTAGTTAALAQSQGVSKTEITLGSIQDLSGPIAGFGKQVRLGMMLRVDEANEPRQDFRHDRAHRHSPKPGRHAGAV